jgi:hypothetical protein
MSLAPESVGRWSGRRIATAATLAIVLGLAPQASPAADEADGLALFEAKIRPVLIEQCYSCHSAEHDAAKGGLRLDSRAAMLQGGDGGPAVEPGDPELSLLIEAIRYDSYVQMPPSKKLPPEVIAAFEQWVTMGAPDPRDDDGSTPEPEAEGIDWDAARSSWAYQAPNRSEPPEVSDPSWVRSPIDAFILDRLDEAGLAPNPEADRRTLARRLSIDLIGLPPDPAEVEAFVADASPNAVEQYVDRLLTSPHFGERWARVWLDLARYAEDQAHIVGDDTSLS